MLCSIARRASALRHIPGVPCHAFHAFKPGRVPSLRTLATSAREQAKREMQERNKKLGMYAAAVGLLIFGGSYAAVPLYKVFCQMTGFAGTTQRADEATALTVKPVPGGRLLRVSFMGEVHDAMPWRFRPTQTDVRVVPGETALAFYTAKNKSDKPITGIATYNVYPPKAGIYFNKIQCFCFEEQRLAAGEEIDMPVFFFIDPEILDDPAMDSVNTITLSYTFFKTGEEEPESNTEQQTQKAAPLS